MVSAESLKSAELFQGLSDSQLEKIAAISKEEFYKAGSTILREGDDAKTLYILQEGKAILEMKIELGPSYPPRRATIEVITRGECFGLSALIPPHIFRFSVVCIDPAKVIAINGAQLWELLEEDAVMGREVMKKLAQLVMSRLTHTRQMLVSERGLALLSEQ
jgi:CRP-like cAMP-binding protein